MSDLPKDAPGVEVDPIEPDEDDEQPAIPMPAPDNAQIQGDDLPGAA